MRFFCSPFLTLLGLNFSIAVDFDFLAPSPEAVAAIVAATELEKVNRAARRRKIWRYEREESNLMGKVKLSCSRNGKKKKKQHQHNNSEDNSESERTSPFGFDALLSFLIVVVIVVVIVVLVLVGGVAVAVAAARGFNLLMRVIFAST